MDKSDNDINVFLSLILRLGYKIVKLATLGGKKPYHGMSYTFYHMMPQSGTLKNKKI
jgi:hypothetical protein